MKIRLILSALALLSFSNPLFSQCIADAGSGLHICDLETEDAIILGASPTASGGEAPYSYTWSIDPIVLSENLTFHASNFLSDTSAANPQLTDSWGYEMSFYLEVEDASGAVCNDTVTYTFSNFGISLITYTLYIYEGDSVQLFPPNVGISEEWPTINSILWEPSSSLNDPNAWQPWASPETDTVYHCTVWDSEGCSLEAPPFQYVLVQPTSISEKAGEQIKVYPTVIDPAADKLNISLPPGVQNSSLQIYSMNGNRVFSTEIRGSKTKVSLPSLSPGTYSYLISTRKGEAISSGVLIFR